MKSSFDYYKRIESPEMYLCNPDQRFLCALNGEDRKLVLRFNDLSELTFTVPKIAGTESSYNLIETKRLVFVDKIGWFQITSVTETAEGDKCSKSVSAKSHQTVFNDRGFVAEERVYMFYNPNDPTDNEYKSENTKAIPSVCGQLYKQLGIRIELSGQDAEPSEDMKEWTLTYIDPSLHFVSRSGRGDEMYEPAEGHENICRSFEAKTDGNGYDFMVNDVENAFRVVFEFDFLYHTIKVRTLDEITQNPTDIYLSFENVINTLDIKEDAEDIVTVMKCEGNDLDITTVNPMGTDYIVDFSYYMKEKNDDGVEYSWMSQELIAALREWEKEYNNWCNDDEQREGHTKGYSTLVKDLQKLFADKSVYDAELQFANLKITDMMAARDQYSNKEDKELEGLGYITAETVDVGAKSMLAGTRFFDAPFDDTAEIVGHVKAPTPSKIIDKYDDNGQPIQFHYEFAFEDEGTEGTAKSLIEDYIDPDDKDEDIQPVPLYFMDDSNRSYCKLIVASEAGVVKDANGFIAQEGTAQVRDVTFQVKGITGGCEITLPDGSTITTSQSNSYFIYNGTRYRAVASPHTAGELISIYCFYVSGFERYTTYTETAGNSGWVEIWRNHINNDITPKRDELQAQIDEINEELKYITDICDVQKFIQGKSQTLYNELSTYWIEGSYSNENYATSDTTTMAERIDLANELMKAARKDLEKASQPQFELTVDSINFIKLYEFKKFTDELELGRAITIEREDGVYYRPALMSLEYDLDSTDDFTMTFSNASKPGDTSFTIADLIKEATSVSRTVTANWANLTDYARNKEDIGNLLMSPLDRTLRVAQENMSRQQFIVDDTGILGRKWVDDTGLNFEPEQMRIINNTILFTDDNWETASLALGKIKYGENGEEAYGLIASVLVGELILGETISIGSKSERVRIDNSGIHIRNDVGEDVFNADENGNLTIKGIIQAEEGKIGGYNIGKTTLTSGNVGMSSDITEEAIAFWAGNSTREEAPFRVTNEGRLVATDAKITGHIEATMSGDDTMPNTINNLAADKGQISALYSDKIECGNLSIGDSAITGINGGKIYLGTSVAEQDRIEAKIDVRYQNTLFSGGYYISVELNKTLNTNKDFVVVCLEEMNGKETRRTFVLTVPANSLKSEECRASGATPPTNVTFSFAVSNSDTYVFYIIKPNGGTAPLIEFNGNLMPNGERHIGSETNMWESIWVVGAECNLSDRNYKNNIMPLDQRYDKLFDALKPVNYLMNNGTSGRKHIGLIAQDLKDAIINAGLTTKDCAAYVEWKNNDGETSCGIRYAELIALNIYEIQELKRKILQLETMLQ